MTGIPDGCAGEELLSAYLDGQLADGELDRVVDHLGRCSRCIARFHDVKAARTAIRILVPLDPPLGVIPHAHTGDELSAYLDGELASAELEAVGRHLGTCTDCRRHLLDLDAARTAVRALPRLEPRPLALAPSAPGRLASAAGLPRRRRRLATAIAAAALVTGLVFGIVPDRDPSTSVDLDTLLSRHNARLSVESGFSVIPAVAPTEDTP